MRIRAITILASILAMGSLAGAQPAPLMPVENANGTNQLPPRAPLPDGTVLVNRMGTLEQTDAGKWQFVAEQDSRMADLAGPLPVLQSSQLAAVAAQPNAKTEKRKYVVNGVVTAYEAQNYLLIESAIPATPILAAEKTAPPATRPAGASTADQTLNQMLTAPPPSAGRPLRLTTGPGNDTTSGKGAVAPNAPLVSVIREGSFLVDRTGRLTRAADGQNWEFSFESDARTLKDPPVLILPNLKLMAMEQAAKSSNRDLKFRITGMVTEYNGRNYVLLEKVVVIPEITQQF
jgi:hypothetical protein